ncbi:hypothetical protein C8R44DRAFT_857624 [Mycena epipterygia]|nr:hypothetical protein C8R44DRAFT_857624 [Mycena epipterygia]
MSRSFRLALGKSTLIFFPRQARDGLDLHESHVVQVMMKSQAMHPTREEVAAYYDAQEDITVAVETIVLQNLVMPLCKIIVIEGDGYVLTAEKKDWVYGRRLELRWGDEEVRPCGDKWVFYFRTCSQRDESVEWF